MRKYFDTVEDNVTGKPIDGATVTVLDAPSGSGGTAQTIYTDEGVTPTTTTGVVETDQYGYFEFFAPDGEYTLEIAVGGTTLKTIQNVEIVDNTGTSADLDALEIRVDALEAVGVDLSGYNSTATDSIAIGTGSKSFTVETGKSFVVGVWVTVAYTTTPANYMFGQVTAYDTGTGAITVNVTATAGSGTYAAWTFSLAAVPQAVLKSGDTMTGGLVLPASTTSVEPLIIPHGVAPSSPTDGSIWVTSAAVFARINGTTYQLGTLAGTETHTNKTFTAPAISDPVLTGTPTEDIYTISDGASVTIDPADGSLQLWTLGANRTPTLTSITAGKSVTLLVNDGSAYTLTLSGVTWVTGSGSAPTLKTTGYTWINLTNIGGTIYAALIGDGG